MALGPIPRSMIKQYGCEELELSGDALDGFITMITRIDGEYLSMSGSPHPIERQAQDKVQKVAKRPRPVPLAERRKGR